LKAIGWYPQHPPHDSCYRRSGTFLLPNPTFQHIGMRGPTPRVQCHTLQPG